MVSQVGHSLIWSNQITLLRELEAELASASFNSCASAQCWYNEWIIIKYLLREFEAEYASASFNSSVPAHTPLDCSATKARVARQKSFNKPSLPSATKTLIEEATAGGKEISQTNPSNSGTFQPLASPRVYCQLCYSHFFSLIIFASLSCVNTSRAMLQESWSKSLGWEGRVEVE